MLALRRGRLLVSAIEPTGGAIGLNMFKPLVMMILPL